MSVSSNTVLTPEHLHTVVDYFMTKPEFAFDTETTGPNRGVPVIAPVVWLSLATEGMAVAVPMGHPNGSRLVSRATRKKNKVTGKFDMFPAVWDAPPPQMRPSEVWSIVKPLFMSDKTKIAQNATFDLIDTAKYFGGSIIPGPYADTIVMQWLLDENMKSKGLKEMVRKYYGVDYDKESVGKCIEIHGFNRVARYAYLDAKFTYFLKKKFTPLLIKDTLEQVYGLEIDLLPVLCAMNIEGADVDVPELLSLKEDLSDRMVDIEAAVYKSAGQRFNINSPQQKSKVLFSSKEAGGQGLNPKEFTPTKAPSTSASALEHFPKNPVVKALVDYQEISTLLNTYVIGYLGDENDKDKPCRIHNGKIHADLVQYGTVTGRFSCRTPNLQNIPRPDTELGKRIRGLFIAPQGKSLIVADYGQIELVVLAHFSKARALVDGFNTGIDAHTMTASKVFGVPVEEVTKEMRFAAKGINFAVVYGAGPDKVAVMAGSTVKEAKGFLAIHEREFPEIYAFKDAVIRVAKSRRPAHLRTLLGRKRRLPELFRADRGQRMAAERQAVNSLIQGSAADLIKFAMIRLHASLPPEMKLILSVHDELVITCPDAMVEEGSRLMREAMLGEDIQALLSVPLTIDLSVVKRWADAK